MMQVDLEAVGQLRLSQFPHVESRLISSQRVLKPRSTFNLTLWLVRENLLGPDDGMRQGTCSRWVYLLLCL